MNKNTQHQFIRLANTNESEPLSEWIHYQDSLTDKLKAITGTIDLELLAQHWVSSSWWDSYILNLKEEQVFQREILMRSQNIEYWYARTIIPYSCYRLNPHFFNRLEKESVRNLIFNTNEVNLVNRICYPVDQRCIEYFWVKKYMTQIEGTLWVRLAEFSFSELESFYLIEILLPELEKISC